MRNPSLLHAVAIAILTMAGAAPAWADDVSFSGFAHGSQTVDIKLVSPDVPVAESVQAGGFSTVRNGGPSFVSYCVDVYQTIGFGDAPYGDYSVATGSHVFANSSAAVDLAKLFGVAGVVDNAVSEAAFQIAVWEIAYEKSGAYGLAGGSATFTGGSADASGALKLASQWLDALPGAGPGSAFGVLDSPTHQDLIFAPVPEPSTVFLMVAGMLGLATYASRTGRAPMRRRA